MTLQPLDLVSIVCTKKREFWVTWKDSSPLSIFRTVQCAISTWKKIAKLFGWCYLAWKTANFSLQNVVKQRLSKRLFSNMSGYNLRLQSKDCNFYQIFEILWLNNFSGSSKMLIFRPKKWGKKPLSV